MGTAREIPFPSDTVLERLANRVITEADRHFGSRQTELAVSLQERMRLAHALQEGLLQSLTGAALQLEAAWHLVGTEPLRARDLVRRIQDALLERQRELREWVESTTHPSVDVPAAGCDLKEALETLCARVTRWGLRTELDVSDVERIPGFMHDCIYRIAEEGLNNVSQHAHAGAAHVELHAEQAVASITIEDDGRGFPLFGRYDLAALNAMQQGPRWLKETVAAHDGAVILISRVSGSRIEVRLPFASDYTTGSGVGSRRAL